MLHREDSARECTRMGQAVVLSQTKPKDPVNNKFTGSFRFRFVTTNLVIHQLSNTGTNPMEFPSESYT